MAKTKIHTVYKSADGTRLPGVTTITGSLGWNKAALMRWAWQKGKDGIDYLKERDEKAECGTIAHGLILEHLGGPKFDLLDYSKNQIDQAENSLLSYYEWEKGHKLETIVIEEPMVSDLYSFGGTPDWYGLLDDVPTLIDYKTGKSGAYDEYKVQVAAYEQLLHAKGHRCDKVMILNIPRTTDESFEVTPVSNLELYWKIFLNCLSTYKIIKKLKS